MRLIAGSEDDGVMPPEGERLSRDEIALFKAWIDQGAVWPAGVEVPELKLGPDHDVAVVVAKHARGEEEAPAAEGGEEKK